MFFERLLNVDEVQGFADTLEPHQRVKGPDGCSLLEAVLIEHNMRAVSRLYTNISLLQLGLLLGVSAKVCVWSLGGSIHVVGRKMAK